MFCVRTSRAPEGRVWSARSAVKTRSPSPRAASPLPLVYRYKEKEKHPWRLSLPRFYIKDQMRAPACFDSSSSNNNSKSPHVKNIGTKNIFGQISLRRRSEFLDFDPGGVVSAELLQMMTGSL